MVIVFMKNQFTSQQPAKTQDIYLELLPQVSLQLDRKLIFLEKKKLTPTSELVYGAPEGKLPFTLSIALTSTSAQHSDVVYTFEGEFNPMLALVVKSPITKLLQTMAEKTKTL